MTAKIFPKFWAAKILCVTQWPAKTTVPVSIRGVPIWKNAGRQKKSQLGTPRYQKEFVTIRGLTDILQSQKVVDEDGGRCIAFLGECSLQLCDEAYLH